MGLLLSQRFLKCLFGWQWLLFYEQAWLLQVQPAAKDWALPTSPVKWNRLGSCQQMTVVLSPVHCLMAILTQQSCSKHALKLLKRGNVQHLHWQHCSIYTDNRLQHTTHIFCVCHSYIYIVKHENKKYFGVVRLWLWKVLWIAFILFYFLNMLLMYLKMLKKLLIKCSFLFFSALLHKELW